MTKKNLVSLVLASALLLTLAACGEKAPSGSGSGSGASDSQAEQPKVAEVTGGSEREGAEEVPLDTKLKGKTVREETQWFSF